MNFSRNLTTLALAAAAALTLSACDRDDSRTAGQRLDSTVAKAERKVDDAADKARQEAAEARSNIESTADKAATAIGNATDKAADATADALITAKVNAELAKDPALSALRIDVDTRDGHVSLSGTAPDAAAKVRATQLASAVEGVTGVDNRLEVRG